MIAGAIVAAGRSIERLYTAYLFAHGRTPTDDLSQAQVNVRLELAAWAIVLCLAVVASLLLRYWHRSKRQIA
jgi:hypothetical protein